MIATITFDQAMAFEFSFAVFGIMMLPFAIPLLSARLRAWMGSRWVVVSLLALLVIIPATLALLTPELLESHWIALQHKSTKFYVRLAEACDSVLAQHPLGTNEAILIPVTDPSLPKAIKDMQPLKLHVNSNGVWMLLDSDSRAGIGLAWEPSWTNSNFWVVTLYGDAPATVIYSTNRSMPFKPALNQTVETTH